MALESIRGNTKLWVYEGEGFKSYSISVGNKQEDGTYLNYSLPVSFAKGVDLKKVENGCDVKISDSWLSTFEKKDGTRHLKLFVNKMTVISEAVKTTTAVNGTKKPLTKAQKDALFKAGIEIDDLPF